MKFFSFRKLKNDKTASDHEQRIAEIEKAQADIASRIAALKSQRVDKIAAGDDDGLVQIAADIRSAEDENENLVLALDLLRGKHAEAQAVEKVAGLEQKSKDYPAAEKAHKKKWGEMLQILAERDETERRLETEKKLALSAITARITTIQDELRDLSYNASQASSEAEAIGRFDLVCPELPVPEPAFNDGWDKAFEDANFRDRNTAWIGSRSFKAMSAARRSQCTERYNPNLPADIKARICSENEHAEAEYKAETEAQRARLRVA